MKTSVTLSQINYVVYNYESGTEIHLGRIGKGYKVDSCNMFSANFAMRNNLINARAAAKSVVVREGNLFLKFPIDKGNVKNFPSLTVCIGLVTEGPN